MEVSILMSPMYEKGKVDTGQTKKLTYYKSLCPVLCQNRSPQVSSRSTLLPLLLTRRPSKHVPLMVIASNGEVSVFGVKLEPSGRILRSELGTTSEFIV